MSSSALAVTEAGFPDLLRSWRKQRKLSQWDLSLEAGISQRHLSFLESGRSSPSREMVIKLAGSLDIPLQERNTLLGSAGFAPMYSAASLDDESLAQARQALNVMLNHHEPFPCLVVDRHWNMIMTNEANLKLFSRFVDPFTVWADIDDPGTQNLVRLVLHPNGIKPYVKNWSHFAGYFMHSLQQTLTNNPFDTGTRELLDEVTGYPEVAEITEEIPSNQTLPFLTMELARDDFEVNLFSMVSTFGSPHDATLQQLRIETFFPADEHSEKLIREMSSH